MAEYMDKIQVNDAITDSTKLDLGHTHITTANWMQLNPIYVREMVAGESINCNVETFTRMNPLPVPTFGRGNIKISKFFVPFRTIFRGWNDFITDVYHITSVNGNNGLIQKVPTVANNEFVKAFLFTTVQVGDADPIYLTDEGTSADYDFIYDDGTDLEYYKFSSYGRQAIKVIESLGYKINWNLQDRTLYSALPLLAFGKVYMDYYYPSQYTNSAIYAAVSGLFNYDGSAVVDFSLTNTQIIDLLSMCIYVCYDSDYFVSAFDTPVGPSVGNFSTLGIADITTVPNSNTRPFLSNAVSSTHNKFGTPVVYTSSLTGTSLSSVSVQKFSQYMDTALHLLTDYVTRNRLAGSRAFDRMLARYGKSLTAEKLNRCVYLGTEIVPLQIGDVMSTSDTVNSNAGTGASLGSFAGKGIGYSNGEGCDYSTDEFGIFIVVSSIVPAVGYYQGIDRNVMHISKLDYWTPEFDNLGVQAITADELYMSYDGSYGGASGATIHNTTFGFTPRFAEYKVGRDQISGSFRIPSLNGHALNAANSWHLMREFDDEDFGGAASAITHSPNFVYGVNDASQFNRIFYNKKEDAPDQFTLIYNFNVVSNSPMKSLYDTYDFCDADKGRKVTLQANGVKVN